MDNSDPIAPTQIEHSIDEVWDGERLEQRYNFLDYHFDEQGCYLRARVYLDDSQTATLFGPFEGRGSIAKVVSPSTEQAVLTYLRRRYAKVWQR
jgi:hypothetical protein